MAKVISFKDAREDSRSSTDSKEDKQSGGGRGAEESQEDQNDYQDLLKRVTGARATLLAQAPAAPVGSDVLLARARKTRRHFAVLDEAAGKKQVTDDRVVLADDDVNAYKQYKNFQDNSMIT